MSVWNTPLLRAATDLADGLLFPAALETDAAPLVPASHLDELARAGMYGLVGPPDAGGLGASFEAMCAAFEVLASGCLSTTFVWIQHHSVVRAVAGASPELRDRWLRGLCSGDVRAGIALGRVRPQPEGLIAEEAGGGWLLRGTVPWVTGWGRIDLVLVAAQTADGRVVRLLADARDGAALKVKSQAMVAANATGTVELTFDGLFVPSERVVSVEAYAPPPPHDGGGRPNGSLALGVARRCCALIGPSGLDAALAARREQLDSATEETMADVRAAASEFAVRAAAALVTHTGSRSLLLSSHAQRLAREAMFVQVFGTRPAIRASLLRRLGVSE